MQKVVDVEDGNKPIGSFIDRRTFLDLFNAGQKVIYYRGPYLGYEVDTDRTGAREFQGWIWDYVIDGKRGTFVQARIESHQFLYWAIPWRRR